MRTKQEFIEAAVAELRDEHGVMDPSESEILNLALSYAVEELETC